MNGKLTLTFQADFCESYSMCLDLDESVSQEIARIPLPTPPELGGTFEERVTVLKQREFRKDFFIRECRRIGTLLAERMEDAEGWHDASRIEPAKRELSGGRS